MNKRHEINKQINKNDLGSGDSSLPPKSFILETHESSKSQGYHKQVLIFGSHFLFCSLSGC